MKKDVFCLNVFLVVILIVLLFAFNCKNKYNNIYNIRIKKNHKIVFLGDSLTEQYRLDEFYRGLPFINSGKGGYTTEDVLNNLEKSVYRYNPTKVFLLIGINDLKKQTKNDIIYKNIIKIVESIKENCPNTEVYVESIYPTNNSNDDRISAQSVSNRSNEDIDWINKKLKKYYKDSNVTFIDVNKELKDKNNLLKLDYTVEGTHITTLGYVRVTSVLIPYLR